MAILYDYKINTGSINMAEDERLLDIAITEKINEPILRLYGWSPSCVSLGRNQTAESINIEYCKKNNIDIVKRLTGGRGLLHDQELTYAFICPETLLECNNSVIASYKEISGALIEGFKEAGIILTFPENKKANTKFDYCMSISTGADLSYDDKKLIGSAQLRKHSYILQHGSILFDYNPQTIKEIFNENIDSESITTMKEINPKIKISDLSKHIISGFEKHFKISFTKQC